VLNQRLNTKGGIVSGIEIATVLSHVDSDVVETKKMIKTMSVTFNNLHKILVHSAFEGNK
jgi:hypothetical protein